MGFLIDIGLLILSLSLILNNANDIMMPNKFGVKINLFKQAVTEFHQDGFVVIPLYSEEETKIISEFATAWLYRVLTPWIIKTLDQEPLKHCHIWSQEISPDHRQAFGSKNRYLYPESSVRKAILNDKVNPWLSEIGLQKYKTWDDGWGDVGFRLKLDPVVRMAILCLAKTGEKPVASLLFGYPLLVTAQMKPYH